MREGRKFARPMAAASPTDFYQNSSAICGAETVKIRRNNEISFCFVNEIEAHPTRSPIDGESIVGRRDRRDHGWRI